MGAETYKQAFKYENLVRIAFDCPRGMRNGADLCVMQNAMTMEDGKTHAKHLGSFDKQFEKVKGYTSKALIKLSKTKPYSAEKDFFLDLDSKINWVGTTAQLMTIVVTALDKVIELRK
ncbi:hypothetical protein EIB75_07810 [Epilithonimonas vandammei]|uniref:Uncharacterized protein n=1 Tax=Epilithonimonas vandammei TaxID=2487072 RepID=A0A3G8ZMQ7_9FLAO|nr:hypothetical protein [Epilithonimonas vandammei]AZI55151.1 hypothetical protein EIB75_07810 [Epilithonimonas vandammei]